MERRPITRQRSTWELFDRGEILGYSNEWHRRRVGDGELVACVAEEPTGWHLSISHRDHRGELSRYPTWDEIAHARDELLPADVDFVMFLPKAGDYVALHATTFHLHEHPERHDDLAEFERARAASRAHVPQLAAIARGKAAAQQVLAKLNEEPRP